MQSRNEPSSKHGDQFKTIPPDSSPSCASSETHGLGVSPYLLAIHFHLGSFVAPIPKQPTVTVGRSADCDITIDDPTLSRKHIVLHLGSQVHVENRGTNRTIVDGTALARGLTRLVASGSVIVVAGTTCVLQEVRPRSTSPPPLSSGDASQTIVRDPEMRRIFSVIDLIGPTVLSVLILGETGTGKEVVAESIHLRSARSQRKFLKLNCAALPSSLLERELFGNERGAFTGADRRKVGILEAASNGTLFLDEVAEMPLGTQAKLLRAVETQEITRIGSVAPIRVDVRIIGATNRSLLRMTEEGLFRTDLYYRLNGTTIELPPLRRRPSEILPLAIKFVRAAAKRANKAVPGLDSRVEELLLWHAWPGNVRELRNAMDRATALCQGGVIHTEDLPPDLVRGANRTSVVPELEPYVPSRPIPPNPAPSFANDRVPHTIRVPPPCEHSEPPSAVPSRLLSDLEDEKGKLEKTRILEALAEVNGNQTKAANLLGISRRTLINKLDRYQIKRPRKR